MNQLPYNPSLQIQHLASVFENTTNSYKFYWFWAVLDLLKEGEQRTEIPFQDILIKMISLSWYTVNYYKLSFGVQDKLSRSIKFIIEHTDLNEDSPKKEIEETLQQLLIEKNKGIKKSIDDLGRYVPYRFIRPFFALELKGGKNVNKQIKELSTDYFMVNEKAPFYKIGKQSIILHQDWSAYLFVNLRILQDFCLWNLVSFLQSRNPNVSNIGNKLLEPNAKRDLKTAKTFWNIAIEQTEIRCIYSQSLMIKEGISIDHFVPWSYVTHDLLWNLSPTTGAINSSKGNNLPSINAYLDEFSYLQYRAFQEVFKLGKKELLEDYSVGFQDELDNISLYQGGVFEKKIKAQVSPLIQIAENLGFTGNWMWE
jgi:hypothetical protein